MCTCYSLQLKVQKISTHKNQNNKDSICHESTFQTHLNHYAEDVDFVYCSSKQKSPSQLIDFLIVHNEQVKITALDKLQLIYAYR